MANELYDVIDGNIIENGEKAITAQSLKNTLYALADGIGKGGGGASGEYIDGRYKNEENMDELLPEAQEHNVGVYERVTAALERVGSVPSLAINLGGSAAYSSFITFNAGIIMALFSFPVMGEFTNISIASIDGTQVNMIGTHLTLLMIYLKSDGTIEVHFPGMEA